MDQFRNDQLIQLSIKYPSVTEEVIEYNISNMLGLYVYSKTYSCMNTVRLNQSLIWKSNMTEEQNQLV